MTAAICEVCGRMLESSTEPECWTHLDVGRDDLRATCFRLGYERQKARAEAAEDATNKVALALAQEIQRSTIIRAELDAIQAEAAAGRVSVPELVNDTMKAAWREGADCSDLRIAQKFVAAITHERTIAAQQRRALVEALRGVEKMSDEREGMGFIERLFRCGQISRAALAAAGEKP